MMEWINMEWGSPLLMAILHSFWQGLLMMTIILVLTKSKIVSASHGQYALNIFGLLIMFICFITTFLIYLSGEANFVVAEETLPAIVVGTSQQSTASSIMSFSWSSIVVLLWIAGTIFSLLRFSFSGYVVGKIRKSSAPASVEWQNRLEDLKRKLGITSFASIHYSLEAIVPMVVGVFKPVIILPLMYFNQMSTDELESILIHELIHIKRKDFLFNVIQRIIESFLFFNPATWWLSNRVCRYREYYCDDQVQRNLATNKSYLKAIYKVASHSAKYQMASVSLINHKSELTMRVKRILRLSNNEHYLKPIMSVFVLSLFALVFFSFQSDNYLDRDVSTAIELEQTAEASLASASLGSTNKFNSTILVEPHVNVRSQSVTDILEVVSSNEITTILFEQPEKPTISVKESKSRLPRLNKIGAIDTVPDNPRIKELKSKLEAKSMELDALAVTLEEQMEVSIEQDAEKLEELAEKMEEAMRPLMEAIESSIDEEAMMELEELTKTFEMKMENLELEMDHEVMEDLMMSEEALHKDIQELEKQEKSAANESALKAKNVELEEVRKKFEQEHEKFEVIHKQFMNDAEIQKMQKDIQKMSKSIHKNHQFSKINKNAEFVALQKEMKAIQKKIQANMKSMDKGIQKKIQSKAREVEAIARELEVEMKKQEKEKVKKK